MSEKIYNVVEAAHFLYRTPLQLAVVAILLALAACQSEPQTPPCPYSNSYQCAQLFEAHLAKHYPRLFSRTDGRLVVSLQNGKSKAYEDIPDAANFGANGEWYNFVQYYPAIGYGLIAVQHYEGGKYLLLNMATGDQFNLDAIPVISPDGKRLAAGNFDESDYTPDELAVYSLTNGNLKVEFMTRDMKWGVENIRWLGSDRISFTRLSVSADFNVIESKSTLTLEPTKNEWTIQTE